jgi:hypothetical protein
VQSASVFSQFLFNLNEFFVVQIVVVWIATGKKKRKPPAPIGYLARKFRQVGDNRPNQGKHGVGFLDSEKFPVWRAYVS